MPTYTHIQILRPYFKLLRWTTLPLALSSPLLLREEVLLSVLLTLCKAGGH